MKKVLRYLLGMQMIVEGEAACAGTGISQSCDERIGFKGLSGKQIALFVGGGFIVMIIVFYLIGNWDGIGNGFICWAQNVAGMSPHYHFPMRDGTNYSCNKIDATYDGT